MTSCCNWKSRAIEFKEVRLTPKIGVGDFDTKVHRAIEFLAGNRNLAMLGPHAHRSDVPGRVPGTPWPSEVDLVADQHIANELLIAASRPGR